MRRFNDTSRWKAFRKLEPSLKNLFNYCWDMADPAGVYEVDWDYLKADLGSEFTEKDFTKFGDKILKIGPGKFLFVEFIYINYGTLKENYNPHKPVFRALEKHNLFYNPSLGVASSKLDSKLEYEYKEEDEEEDEYKGGVGENEIPKKKRKKKEPQTPPHLFSDSEFFDLLKFEEAFAGTDYEFCDLKIYYEKIKNWSASGGNKKVDWIATARNFMLSDKEKGKLILKQGVYVEGSNEGKPKSGITIDSIIAGRKYD